MHHTAIPTVPGTPFEGGFYAGRIRVEDQQYALIVAPKAEGQHDATIWHSKYDRIEGALCYCDGRANTIALAESGSELARWMLTLKINGFDDWYLPSRDEKEICYRNLKPTADKNVVSFRDGDNPSSVPVGYSYTERLPAQTIAPAFVEGGTEAFDSVWYWTSTQCASNAVCAWRQYFGDGSQDYVLKGLRLRARAVRRLTI